jgi:thiol-disulfide isomerase/thioredoxin
MNVWIVVGIAILLVSMYYIYLFFYPPKPEFIPNNEFVTDNEKKGEVILFYTEWCPHCKTTMPMWINYKERFDKKKYSISFREVDCDAKLTEAERYGIDSYPTIILVVNEKRYIYDSEFSPETMDKFINTIFKL